MYLMVTSRVLPQLPQPAGFRYQARNLKSRRLGFLRRSRRGFGYLGDCSDPAIQQQITDEANRQGVPPAIALAVAQQESNCTQAARNQNANGTTDIGMFQLNSSTFPNTDPGDQAGNIRQGVSYLSQMYARFGNWPQALAAYNGGPGNISGAAPVRYSAAVYNKAVNQWGLLKPAAVTTAATIPDTGTSSSVDTAASQAGSGIDWATIAMWAGGGVAVLFLLSLVMD